MATKATYKVPFRRRRDQKTNYAKRLAVLKSGNPRMVVRTSNQLIRVQIIEYIREGDKTLVDINSKELKNHGWPASFKSLPAAYLTGYLAAKKAIKAGTKKAVLDIGLVTPVMGSKPFAVLKGALDAGMQIPHDDKCFPKEERLSGKHIQDYANLLGDEFSKRFSDSLKKGFDAKKTEDFFAKAKESINKENGA